LTSPHKKFAEKSAAPVLFSEKQASMLPFKAPPTDGDVSRMRFVPSSTIEPVSLRPEAQLLVACAKTLIDAETASRIEILLRQNLDWEYLVQKALANRVMPLLSSNLLQVGLGAVPLNILKDLQEYLQTHARHNLGQTRMLVKLLRLLEEHGISALPFKGPTLAVLAYHNLSLRQFDDLDILVSKSDLIRVMDLLKTQGFEVVTAPTWFHRLPLPFSRKKDYGLISHDKKFKIELHWRLSGTHFDFRLGAKRLWSRLETIKLAGTPVRSLPPDILLLYLCVHGSRHSWERLEWISDVAELIRVHPELDWMEIVEKARLSGSERVLFLGLFLAKDLLGISLPEWLWLRVQAEPVVQPLATHVRERLFGDGNASLGMSTRYKHHLGMKERPRDKVRVHLHYFFRYLKLAVRPNSGDYELHILPTYFAFVYYLLRPLRLTNQYVVTPIKRTLRSSK